MAGKEGINMTDRDYMDMAIRLAKKGEGWTDPNPFVGAVIVKDGKIIGQGFHEKYGCPHAERNAIGSLSESAEGAVLYVTLEPCCHYGKTPPCTDVIIEKGISKVVIGSRDPNPKVAGKGAEILRKAGVDVYEDFMKEECDRLNPVFFYYITAHMPYVVMKYAMTADGKTATKTGASKWITGDAAREEVQHMRGRYTGIMAGIGTVLSDDPILDSRINGLRSPVRIICDSRLRIPEDSKICRTAHKQRTIIACAENESEKSIRLKASGVEILECPGEGGHIDLRVLMGKLADMKINSILLEGGGTLNESVLRAGLVNEIKMFIAPKIFGGSESRSPVEGAGIEMPDEAIPLRCRDIEHIGEDILISYEVERKQKCLPE